MNKFLLGVLMLYCSALSYAQAPQGMSFQAVARDVNGNVLSEKTVAVKVEILQGSASGTVVYGETHKSMAAKNGVVNLQIGQGTVTDGTFAGIDWSRSPYFLQISMDADGGSSYKEVFTQQMLSVPYALYAERAGNVKDDVKTFDVMPVDWKGAKLLTGLAPELEYGGFGIFVSYPDGINQEVQLEIEGLPAGISFDLDSEECIESGPQGRYLPVQFNRDGDVDVAAGNYDCTLILKNKYGVVKSYPFTYKIQKIQELLPSLGWNTDADVRNALTEIIGIYQEFKSMNMAIDNAFMGKSDDEQYAVFKNKTYIPSSGEINLLWAKAYRVIYQCNNLIEGLSGNIGSGVTEEVKTNAVKQAKAIRAYAHLMLTEWFGAVPLVMRKLDEYEAMNISRTSRDEVLVAAVSDFEEAQGVEPLFEQQSDEILSEEIDVLLLEARLLKKDWQGVSGTIGTEDGIRGFIKKVADWKSNSLEEITEASLMEEYMNDFHSTDGRGNLYLNVLEYGATYFEDMLAHKVLFPIPQDELMYNSNLTQNDGY